MAYRHLRKSSNAFSTSAPYGKQRASTARSGRSSDTGESFPGFGTPGPPSVSLHGRASKTHFSRMSSVTRSLGQISSPTLPPPKQKRASLRPPTSHITSNLPSPAGLDEHVEESEAEEDIQRREDADSLNEIIMAINMKERGTLGCAYYIAREEKLCLMEDIKMAGLDIVELLKLHAQPTILLISSRAEEELEDHLMREARPVDRGDGDSEASSCTRQRDMLTRLLLDSIFGCYVLDSRPSGEFQFEAAKNKLINLDIALEHGPEIVFTTPGDDLINDGAFGQGHNDCGVGRQGKLMRLAGWMDLDSRLAVRVLIYSHLSS
jgi:DNA mismatch repair protein MSH5